VLLLCGADYHVLVCCAAIVVVLQQPELDPITQAATKAELDRGIDKTTSFPVDGEQQQQLGWPHKQLQELLQPT
jgi:hypothetical protein